MAEEVNQILARQLLLDQRILVDVEIEHKDWCGVRGISGRKGASNGDLRDEIWR